MFYDHIRFAHFREYGIFMNEGFLDTNIYEHNKINDSIWKRYVNLDINHAKFFLRI